MNRLKVMAVLFTFSCRFGFAAAPTAQLIEVHKIWDAAPHNAFTDLIHWRGHFVCAFREGRGHVSSDGKIRVLTSTHGDTWQPAALLALDGYDLRDAGLCRAPDGRLMLIGGASPRRADHETAPTGTFVSFSDDAVEWSEPTIIVEPGRWLWRVAWHGGKAFGVSYAAGTPERATSLLTSDDGLRFHSAVPKLFDNGYPTEAALRFDDGGTLYCLQRRDGARPTNTAMLGISKPPYSDWQWHDLGIFFGGPNFIELPTGQWLAAGRIVRAAGTRQPVLPGAGSPKTELASLDMENKKLSPILQLPSGGDTSYPGLAWHDDILWVSYYSSHEGKTSIYLAKVKLE